MIFTFPSHIIFPIVIKVSFFFSFFFFLSSLEWFATDVAGYGSYSPQQVINKIKEYLPLKPAFPHPTPKP